MILAIVLVGVLIFLHEAGHFTVAKAMNVRVKAFSIGFGPALFKVRRGETIYQVCLVPFGGYVMFDDADPDGTAQLDPRAFEAQSTGRRALIAVAGVLANVVVALCVLLALYGFYGLPRMQVTVTGTVPSSPAAVAGLRKGDQILSVAGLPMSTDAAQVTGIIARHDLKPITVVIRRQGRTFPIRLIPRPIDGSPKIGVYLAERQIYVTRGASMTARLGQAFSSTWQVLTVLVAGFVKLVTGQVPTSQMGGPVRIVSMTSEIAATGLASLLYWLALLSANLAVLNVVPFPGLDGGRLAFLLGEFLARGRRNIRVEQTINFIGLVVLMLFIGVLTVQDIVSLHP